MKDYEAVTPNEKIRLTLVGMADKYNEQIRDKILLTYNDKKLLKGYENIRNSGMYQKGGKTKVHRKIVEFPSPEVFDFVNKVMTGLYGVDWLYDNKALKHDLVKPWWVVKSL